MTLSIYTHYRTEMRDFLTACNGDTEVFIDSVGDMLGRLTVERNQLQMELKAAEAEIVRLEEELETEISTIVCVRTQK